MSRSSLRRFMLAPAATILTAAAAVAFTASPSSAADKPGAWISDDNPCAGQHVWAGAYDLKPDTKYIVHYFNHNSTETSDDWGKIKVDFYVPDVAPGTDTSVAFVPKNGKGKSVSELLVVDWCCYTTVY